MNKKYIVRLTDEERAVCEATVKKEKRGVVGSGLITVAQADSHK